MVELVPWRVMFLKEVRRVSGSVRASGRSLPKYSVVILLPLSSLILLGSS